MSAVELAASIPVAVGEHLSTARALEDAAVAAHAPAVAARLRAIDREHDRAMSALRATYQGREAAHDEEWPDPPRDSWALDALALVVTAVALAVIIASARFGAQWDARSAAALGAALLGLTVALHGVNALRARRGSVSNARASSIIGFDAVAALAGAGLIAWRASLPRGGAALAEVAVPLGAAVLCGLVLVALWIDARRRGAPARARLARYRQAEASWRADLDAEAAELAAAARAAALACVDELSAPVREALLKDLVDATQRLQRRDDVPHDVASALREAPFGFLRYDDRV